MEAVREDPGRCWRTLNQVYWNKRAGYETGADIALHNGLERSVHFTQHTCVLKIGQRPGEMAQSLRRMLCQSEDQCVKPRSTSVSPERWKLEDPLGLLAKQSS